MNRMTSGMTETNATKSDLAAVEKDCSRTKAGNHGDRASRPALSWQWRGIILGASRIL